MDLTEILKGCPERTKFYSSYLGKDVFFTGINNNYIECEYLPQIDSPFNSMIQFRKEGSLYKGGECMLFPSKDQRDWSKWQRPFVDGDIVINKNNIGTWIGIYHKDDRLNETFSSYCYIRRDGIFCANSDNNHGYYETRLATKEEKQKLFKAIQENGYKWNAETKTLEKLIVPKFKVGDKIKHKDTVLTIITVRTDSYIIEDDPGNFGILMVSQQDNWELINEPKFKVGDRKEKKGECWDGIIKCIDTDNFYNVKYSSGAESFVNVKYQNEYELIPNKFDPKTLKPFDKVIVRDFDNQKWMACLFSHIENGAYHKFKTVAGLGWHQCIPFNNDTKHLVGKMDKAPEFYRYWEE